MKKNISKKNNFTEAIILDRLFSKLNFNKPETFNFKNDAAFLKNKSNHKIIATNDSISENIDFFINDDPKSIAQKIITYNLSDLSAMGAMPYCYMLNLCLTEKINYNWLKIFTNHLLKLQKKYNFFLLGGDLSKSKSLMISNTFYGYAKSKYIIPQNKIKNKDDIWVTGNLGDSCAGFKIKKNKKIKLNLKYRNYFLNKYYLPKPCMLGFHIARFCSSAIDISDGFYGDLNKMLNNNFGAILNFKSIPISKNLKKMINNNLIELEEVLNWGDDYQLIFTSHSKFEKNIIKIAKEQKVKITKIGRITNRLGLYTDSLKLINSYRYYDHFA